MSHSLPVPPNAEAGLGNIGVPTCSRVESAWLSHFLRNVVVFWESLVAA